MSVSSNEVILTDAEVVSTTKKNQPEPEVSLSSQPQPMVNIDVKNEIESPESLKQTGNIMYIQDKYDEALTAYTKAIELILEDNQNKKELLAQLYQNRAAVYERLGSNEDVIRETSWALDLQPESSKCLYKRAKAHRACGLYEAALIDISQMKSLEEENLKYSIPNLYAQAKKFYQEVANYIATQEAVQLLKTRTHVDASKHFIKRYLKTFINCPLSKGNLKPIGCMKNGGYNLALKLLKAEEYDKIMDLCTEELLLAESKCKVEASYLRGSFRLIHVYREGTIEDFDYVIANSMNKKLVACAHVKNAVHYHEMGKYEESAKSFELAETVWPENTDLWYHWGEAQFDLEDLNRSLKCFTKAVEMKPDHAVAGTSRVYVFHKIGQKAIVTCTSVVVQISVLGQILTLLGPITPPDNCPEALSISGDMLMNNGSLKEDEESFNLAEAQYSKVLELDPLNTTFITNLAVCRLEKNRVRMEKDPEFEFDFNETIQELQNALKIDDKNPKVYANLAKVYHLMETREKAMKNIFKGLEFVRGLDDIKYLFKLKKKIEMELEDIQESQDSPTSIELDAEAGDKNNKPGCSS